MRPETESIVKAIDKTLEKVEKNAVKQLKQDSKSENYKTLDVVTRSVAKSADKGTPAPELKKVKDICNKFDRSESVSRADVEKLAKASLSYLLTMPVEEKVKRSKTKLAKDADSEAEPQPIEN